MSFVPLQLKTYLRILLVGVIFFSIIPSSLAQGQGQVTDPVIENVQVAASTPICAGSEVEISFDVENGNDKNLEYFTSQTLYKIELQYTDGNGTIIPIISREYKSSIAPNAKNFEFARITNIFFKIPENSPPSTTYQVLITSTNPEVLSAPASNSFEVKTENIWTGALNSDWNDKGNWECKILPNLYSNVVIPSGLANYPTINTGANALAKNLTIEAGAGVTVINNWLRISGNLANSGNLDAGNGSISFEGISAQVIPAGAFTGDRILNLQINNPAGVVSQAVVEVTNSLKVESGTFATGNALTLISNNSGTAFIDGSGSGEVTGTVKMQRHLNNGFGYKYFSSPFSNTTVGDFSGFMELSEPTTGFPHFYQYLENRKDPEGNDLTGWQAYIQPGNPLSIAEGYALNISASATPVDIEIKGEANNGPIDISLQNNKGTYTNGFNLVGNPYPSPIDWNVIASTLNGIDNAVYFFTAGADNRYTGTYTSYVNGISTDGRASSIIPSMQGFFVRVSDPAENSASASAILSFTNAARTGNQVRQNFYKTKEKRAIPKIRLTAGFKNEKLSDAAIIYFHRGATSEFEKELDAFKLLNTAAEVPNLYTLTTKQEKLSINAINSAERQEIPLGIKAEKAGKMLIKLSSVEHIFPGSFIYLKDQKNKLIHNLSEKPIYGFTSQKGEINNRFYLLLTSEELSENEISSSLEYFSVYSDKGEILVRLNLPENHSGVISLSNISGQVLQKKSAKQKEELHFSGIAAPGVYLISLEMHDGRITKKILLKK